MILGRLNHVGVATPSIDKSVVLYRETMGAQVVRDAFDLAAVVDRDGARLRPHLEGIEDRLDKLLDRA